MYFFNQIALSLLSEASYSSPEARLLAIACLDLKGEFPIPRHPCLALVEQQGADADREPSEDQKARYFCPESSNHSDRRNEGSSPRARFDNAWPWYTC